MRQDRPGPHPPHEVVQGLSEAKFTVVPQQNLVWDEHRLVFYLVHKAASSSAMAAFITAAGGNPEREKLCRNERFRWMDTDTLLREVPDYKRVSIVRNPFARLVSCYEYRVGKKGRRVPFRDYVNVVKTYPYMDSHYWPQVHQVRDAHLVAHLESIETGWREICDYLNVDLPDLPHRNAIAHDPYREYYDHVSRDLAEQLYAEDCKAFGYEF